MVNANDQLRKDVDDLYDKIKGNKGLVTSEELDKAIQDLQGGQYDISEIDSKVAQFNSDLNNARTELNGIIEDAHNSLDDSKEDKANKTSSFNTTPNNTRYPSEKLVKDSLDGKAPLVHTHTAFDVSYDDDTWYDNRTIASITDGVIIDNNGNDISDGVTMDLDHTIEMVQNKVDTKFDKTGTLSANQVDVMVSTLHQDAQSLFEDILYWQSQHSGGSGGSSSLRIFRANARWNNTNKYFNISSVELPDSWATGDIFIINFPTGNSGHLFGVSETPNQPDYFMVNGDKHYVSAGNLDLRNWFQVDELTSLILILEDSWYDNGEMGFLWKIIYNDWAWYTIWDLEIKDNLTSTRTTASLSANQGRILNEKITTYTNDTGWVDLDFTDITDFESYNTTSYKAEYRVVGKQTYIRGAVKCLNAVTSTNAGLVMAKIPSQYAPSKAQYFVQQGNNAYRFLLIIDTSGNLKVARYTNSTTTNQSITENSWLGLSCSYLID